MTDVLAIYGAGLSTFTAAWNYFRTRAQVRLLLVFALETLEGESVHGVGISVQNISTQTVHITNVSLLYPFVKSTLRTKLTHLFCFKQIRRNDGWCHSNLSLHGVEDGCPTSIEPGQSHYIFLRHEVLDGLLQDAKFPLVKAVAQDALWRNTYSKTFEYPTQQKSV